MCVRTDTVKLIEIWSFSLENQAAPEPTINNLALANDPASATASREIFLAWQQTLQVRIRVGD